MRPPWTSSRDPFTTSAGKSKQSKRELGSGWGRCRGCNGRADETQVIDLGCKRRVARGLVPRGVPPPSPFGRGQGEGPLLAPARLARSAGACPPRRPAPLGSGAPARSSPGCHFHKVLPARTGTITFPALSPWLPIAQRQAAEPPQPGNCLRPQQRVVEESHPERGPPVLKARRLQVAVSGHCRKRTPSLPRYLTAIPPGDRV